MSGALSALSTVSGVGMQAIRASGALSSLGPLSAMFGTTRKIDTIIPDVTIEESHSDRLTVTQHPIADGSPISDHAFKMPGTITMRCGFSNASGISGAIGSGIGALAGGASIGSALGTAGSSLLSSFTEQRATQVYKSLLKLQFDQDAWNKGNAALKQFQLTTGKRTYPAVVITELSVRTDRTSEYALMIEVHMQEVFIVTTASTTQPSQTDQANPSKTSSSTDQSQKSPTPAANPNSRLKTDTGYSWDRA